MNKRLLTAVPMVVVLAGGSAVAVAATMPRAQAASATVTVNASKTKLRFSRSTVTVKHGRVTLVMGNPSRKQHGIAVALPGPDRTGRIVKKNGTSRVTVTLKKGHYTFYCQVEDHRALGMKGTIVAT